MIFIRLTFHQSLSFVKNKAPPFIKMPRSSLSLLILGAYFQHEKPIQPKFQARGDNLAARHIFNSR